MLEQVKIKLTTEDESLKLVAEEIIKRCESEPALIEKVLSADKTIDDCWDYIKSEAKKKARLIQMPSYTSKLEILLS